MTTGKGTLSKLEKLKTEYAEKFKAAAPKYRKINQRCFDLLCPYAIGEIGMDRGGVLRTNAKTCKRKRCPKDKGDDGQARRDRLDALREE